MRGISMTRCCGSCVGAILILLLASVMPALSLNVTAEYQEMAMYKKGVYGANLKDWYDLSIGGLSTEVTKDVAIVQGIYDPLNTVPGSFGWNAAWLVSDDSYVGGVDFSATVTVNSAVGVEWFAGIGLVVNESASVLLENCVAWGARVYTSASYNSVGFYSMYNPTHSQGTFNWSDVVIGQSMTYRIVAFDGLADLYINDNLCGTLAFPTDELNVFLDTGVKYEGTSISVTYESVTIRPIA